MARVTEKVRIRLLHDNGMVDGKQTYTSNSYNDVKLDATDEAISVFSECISNLSEKAVLKTYNIKEDLITA